ncbi:unnamed protein product, partial [Mesorhabditis belari]|uniref:Saposin B-type domain-containing protein n=1 Tax=Mesorhabditis belari TaxID=2138241 RepID=A0AAF3FP25_9BILA
MRFYVLIGAALCLALVFGAPKRRGTDNCGLISGPKGHWKKTGQADIWCEMCLDITEILKTYEECGEEKLAEKLDEYCQEKFGNGTFGNLCIKNVNEIAHEAIDDTADINSTSVCDSLTKEPDCKFRLNFEYVLY